MMGRMLSVRSIRAGAGPRMLVLAVSIALVAAACNTSSPSPSVPGPTAAPGSQEPGSAPEPGTTLTAALSDLSAMDWTPALSSGDEEKILAQIGDNLTDLNRETSAIEPGLAESWEISEDGTTWTWKLRPDVPFHDGWGTVTSEDVKFTYWEWARPDTSTHSIGPQLLQAIDGNLDNFEIVDELTFRLHTTNPVVQLPALLCSCNPGPTITSKKYFDETPVEEANDHPIGTGPFKFVSGTPGLEIELEAVPGHPWRQTPSFERLTLLEVADGAARLAQVQSGEVDIALLDSQLVGEATAAGLTISTIKDFGNAFVLLGGSYWGDEALDRDSPWIQADAPEKGLAIRQAMSLAIDRQLIIDRVLNGQATLAYGPLIQYPTPDFTDPSWTYPEYNLELAREKLAEGGYPEGFPVTVALFSDDIDTAAVDEAIAGMWEQLGLDVTRMPTEKDAIDPLQENRTTDGLAYVLISGFVPEPAKTLSNYDSRRPDDAKLFLPELDAAYDAISVETDYDRRMQLTRDIIEVLRDQYQPITLFTVDMPFVTGPDVASWSPIPGTNFMNSLETITPR